jgi:hypothetical protein
MLIDSHKCFKSSFAKFTKVYFPLEFSTNSRNSINLIYYSIISKKLDVTLTYPRQYLLFGLMASAIYSLTPPGLPGLIASVMYSLTPPEKAWPFRPLNTHGLSCFQIRYHTYIPIPNLIVTPRDRA